MAADASIEGLLIETIVFDEGFLTSGGLSLSSWSDWSPLSEDEDEDPTDLTCGCWLFVVAVKAIKNLF